MWKSSKRGGSLSNGGDIFPKCVLGWEVRQDEESQICQGAVENLDICRVWAIKERIRREKKREREVLQEIHIYLRKCC